MWCLAKWNALQPLLEGRIRDTAPAEMVGERNPCPSSVVETVEDSQDFAVENGSRVQVVQTADGSQRPLSQQEREQIEFDEMVEEEAAEMERETEAHQWNLFVASEYRSWEEWAISVEHAGGPVKRARVQILVQGLGGRVVRDVNWLIPLTEGEQLSYAVKVRPAEVEKEEHEAHPDAAPSGINVGSVVASGEIEDDAVGGDGADEEECPEEWRSMLPVTGLQSAPVLENSVEMPRTLTLPRLFSAPLESTSIGTGWNKESHAA